MLHMYLFLLFGPWSIIFTATAVETPNPNYNPFFSRTSQSALVNIGHRIESAPPSPTADWVSRHKQSSKLDDHVLTTGDTQPSILVKLVAGDISGLALLFTDNELKQSGEYFGFVPSVAIILFGGSKRNKQQLRNNVSRKPSFNLATLLSAIASASEADETNDYSRNIVKPIEETTEIPSLDDDRNTFTSHNGNKLHEIHEMPSSSDYDSLDPSSQLKEKSVEPTSKPDERIGIPNLEVSHKLATALCLKMKEEPFDTNPRYMWAPIRQHLPVWRTSRSMNRYLSFTTKCLKWSLRQCRGDVIYPLKNPCTYWSPMSIKSPECGFDTITSTKLVNYRPPHFTPENCPCIWPCTESFDFIQQCRVVVSDVNPDALNSLGRPSPGHEIEIEEDMAKQLCAGMKPMMNVKDDIPVPIRWLPLQTDIIDDIKNNDTEKNAPNYGQLRQKNEIQRVKRFAANNVSINVKRDFGISNESIFMENQLNTDGRNLDSLSSHLLNCMVWKYKECERPFDNQAWTNKAISAKVDSMQTPMLVNTTDYEEKIFQDEKSTKRRRNKRSATSELIDPVGAEEDSDWAEVVRVKRQRHNTDVNSFQNIPDNQPDKVDSESCGQWIRTESHRCTPVISALDPRQEIGDFRKFQRKHVACLHFEENDEIICKIRANRNNV